MTSYRVTAPCVVHIPIATPTGATLGTLYRGTEFSGDPDSDKIRHLLRSGMIEEVGGEGTQRPGGPADGSPAEKSGGKTADERQDTAAGEQQRAEQGGQKSSEPSGAGGPSDQEGAQDSGTLPPVTARSSKPDLIAHGVAAGGDLEELKTLTKEELVERFVRSKNQQ